MFKFAPLKIKILVIGQLHLLLQLPPRFQKRWTNQLRFQMSDPQQGLGHSAAAVAALGAGGLSGRVLRERSTAVLARAARRIEGRIPLIGVGGVDSAEAAWEKILHGASLIQIYSALIYHGPDLLDRIHQGLLERLDASGAKRLEEVVGSSL